MTIIRKIIDFLFPYNKLVRELKETGESLDKYYNELRGDSYDRYR